MRPTLRSTLRGALLGAAVALVGACVPVFLAGFLQSLNLSFELERAIADGEKSDLHIAAFPEKVQVKKRFVRVAGQLTPPAGGGLPGRVKVLAEVEDPANGKVVQRINVNLAIAADGRFEGRAKIRKDIGAGEVMTISLEPSGRDLEEGTLVALCVDLVQKRADLKDLPPCVEPAAPPGDDVTFSSLQRDFFTPTCAVAGCHSAASAREGLVLAAGQAYANLVNVPSRQRPELSRVTPNDPANSYLIRKLRGVDANGSRMPQGGPFLSDEEIDRFVRWIDGGAPEN